MDSVSWLQYLSYLAFIVLVVGVLATVIKYLTMPIHLRWELYPVPHEKKSSYGGSYMEELEWWTKPREKDFLNQILFMAQEIILIRALYHHNRKMWYASFPFHFGLYLIIGWLVLLLMGAILNAFGLASSLVDLIQTLAVAFGGVGLILGILGCLGLIIRRATAEELKGYTAPIDYFNLFFILAVLVSGLVAWGSSDPGFLSMRDYLKGLITIKPVVMPSASLTLFITLFSLFLIYLPFTHMTHFFMKYFMWDKIRFDDEPNRRGSAIESKVAIALNFTQHWSAPHIHKGTKWSETATKGVE
ncbi:MAG: respiratory nitrate reductase subunit gamma [Pseudomonadota bacterium]